MSRVWSGGHSSALLCVGVSCGAERLVVTGAEAGHLTVWSDEGLALAQLQLEGGEDVTSALFSHTAPHRLYASHGRGLSVLDGRSLRGPVETLRDAGEEEINCLSLSGCGQMLAAADDSGCVRVIDLQRGRVSHTLRAHTNICSSVTFRPQGRSLVSAGLDSQVALWAPPRPRPLWLCSLQEEACPQTFNPPLAHCVEASACGSLLACAAEDGAVHLLKTGGDSRLRGRGRLQAHTQGVSQVRFLHFLSHPHWLATGGNDGRVTLWDVSQHPLVGGDGKQRRARRRGGVRAGGGDCGGGQGPRVTFDHGQKVNWLCAAELRGKPSLLVTDQTSQLTLYSLQPL